VGLGDPGIESLTLRRNRVGTRRAAARVDIPSWQVLVGVVALFAAIAAVWVTLEADFLRYPGWLAAQKADFILGPVFVGLYWMRRRPRSRFGPMLIVLGFVGAVYVLQSSANSWLFGIGLVSENLIYLATLLVILTFPTGRLEGPEAKLILLGGVFVAASGTLMVLLLPQLGAGASISACRALCPHNALAVTSQPALALDVFEVWRPAAIVVSLATAGLLVRRLLTGTPPQRRALAIGTPIALLFLLLQIVYLLLMYWPTDFVTLHEAVRWTFVGARALIWYGFLAALIAAQLFAARALQRLVRQSLRRPSRGELEALLREPLGDPELRLVFLDPGTAGSDDSLARPVLAEAREPHVTVVERDGTPSVALVHDPQLDDDPELLRAAGAVALLAAENAELDAAWHEALRELRESRARIVRAGDEQRRRLERDLHDGVQQRLAAIRIDLGTVSDVLAEDSPLRSRLDRVGQDVEEALDEVREVSHGLYPPVLSDWGVAAALERIRLPGDATLELRATGIGRYPAELESAVYYCCLEAIQNATKHGGPGVRISIALREDANGLSFEVRDDGPGFDASTASGGMGLQNMRDRLGALDGRLSITTAGSGGTTVSGSVPVRMNENPTDPRTGGELPHADAGADPASAYDSQPPSGVTPGG
jgi:signal transduction histidine kinase